MNASHKTLSIREIQCLELLAMGHRIDGVAATLGTAPKTVEKQIASARHKLGASTREQAVALAIRHQLLQFSLKDSQDE